MKEDYDSYPEALEECGLKLLSERRSDLCLKFARKCVKIDKTSDIFPTNDINRLTRVSEKYKVEPAATDRLRLSAIPFMQRLLNSQIKEKMSQKLIILGA